MSRLAVVFLWLSTLVVLDYFLIEMTVVHREHYEHRYVNDGVALDLLEACSWIQLSVPRSHIVILHALSIEVCEANFIVASGTEIFFFDTYQFSDPLIDLVRSKLIVQLHLYIAFF